MGKLKKKEKDLKMRDIRSIDFGTNLIEIISSLEILIILFSHEDEEIEEACKVKLEEGFELLKRWSDENSQGLKKK